MVDEEVKKEQAQEELDYETYSKQAMIDGPIAGQSLLTDPASPRPDGSQTCFRICVVYINTT
jgi:hypothetical protein